MSPDTAAFPGADGVYLSVDDERVTLRCDTHPDLNDAYPYADDHRVPVQWVINALTRHLKDHAAALEDAPADDERAGAATAAASPLDEFGRRIAALCRWAMDHNRGDPDKTWPTSDQLAVALVLGNHLYLQDMGPGPGYNPQQAMFLLWSGMAHQPPDLDGWVAAIRAQIRQPGRDGPSGLWIPGSGVRVERGSGQ